MTVPDIKHLHTAMYQHEYFIEHGIFTGDPEREIPPPPPPELYNIADDPLEQHDLAATHPQEVRRLERELDRWFESVERDRRSITDEWIVSSGSGW